MSLEYKKLFLRRNLHYINDSLDDIFRDTVNNIILPCEYPNSEDFASLFYEISSYQIVQSYRQLNQETVEDILPIVRGYVKKRYGKILE
jgi:hypothetical protein